MWNALTAVEWEWLKSCLADHVHHEDVPTEDSGARDRWALPKAIS